TLAAVPFVQTIINVGVIVTCPSLSYIYHILQGLFLFGHIVPIFCWQLWTWHTIVYSN
ncbi:hypothetical protein B0H19DRAFT_1170618, partial [Mycena capillaripes]